MATTITGKQIRDSTITVDDISSSAQEQFAKTKVSSGDTTTDYLSDKIVAGPNIIVNIVNTGSYETLAISASLSSAAVTALNNAATNRLVTIGSPTSELDGTGDLTFDGSIFSITASMLVDGNMVIQSVTGAFLGDLTGTASEASQVSSTLSDGTGITTFSFNGSSPATVAIDESIVVTLTGSQTLSNKIVSGSFSGSYVGDGSGLTGVTAEWDGTHVGDAQITGTLYVTEAVEALSFTGSFLGDVVGTASFATEVGQVSNELTDGTGITDFTFDGSSAATVAIDDTIVATLTGSQTLSNKIVSGSFSGSFVGDGSGLTGITAEWDGTHVGDAQITGTLYVTEAVVAQSVTASFLGDVAGTASEASKVTNALVDGTGITDFTFDGSSPATVSIDETIVATLTGSQTLSNKIISGSFSGSYVGDGSGLTGVTAEWDGTHVGDAQITGTLFVTEAVEALSFTGSLLGDVVGTASFTTEAAKVSNALVDGTGITNFSFDGSAPASVSIDETIVVTLTGSQTLTNKIITGSFSGSFAGDGSGLTNITASAAGSTNEIQFNTGGILDASPNLVFSGSVLKVTSSIETTSITGSLLGDVIGTASFATEAAKVSNTLVDGTGITNFSFDGSTPATVSIDETIVVTLTGSQTLTNKIITGSFSGSFFGDGSFITNAQVSGSNLLWVDVSGSDASGTRERFDKPYASIGGALSSASAGDVVVVRPGIYEEVITMVDGVSVTGMDRDRCVLKNYSGGYTVAMADNCAFEHMSLDVQGSNGFEFTGTTGGTSAIRHTRITSTGGNSTGVVIGGTPAPEPNWITCDHVDIKGSGFANAFLNQSAGDVNFRDCFGDTALIGLHAASTSTTRVQDCRFSGFYGMYIASPGATVYVDQSTRWSSLINSGGSLLPDLTHLLVATGSVTEIQISSGTFLSSSANLTFSGSLLAVTGALSVTESVIAQSFTGSLLGDIIGTSSFATEAAKVSNALVDGTGITNFSFDGSAPATVSIDESIVVTLTGSQTLSNKVITGSFSGSFFGDGSGLTGVSASAAGNTNEIQFNTGGILDASPSLTFDGSTLKVTSSIETTSVTASFLGDLVGTASEASKVTNSLVDGTGITNFSFDGSAPASVSIDETIVVTLTGSQTLTNKIITGSFSGSFFGDGSGLTGITASIANPLTSGHGIETFSYDGSTAETVTLASGSISVVDTTGKSTFYSTLSGALAAAVSGEEVEIGPGEYLENDLLVPSGVSVRGYGGWSVTRVGTTSSASNIMTLSDDSYIDNLSFNIPTGSGLAALVYTGSAGKTAGAYNITLFGDGGTGSGDGIVVEHSGSGNSKLIGTEIRCDLGGLDSAVIVRSGIVALESIHVPSSTGTINKVVSAVGTGRTQLVGFNVGNPNVVDAMYMSGSSTNNVFNANFFNCQNGFHFAQDGVDFDLIGGKIEVAALTALVDPAVSFTTASSISFDGVFEPTFSFPASAVNADFSLTFNQKNSETRLAASRLLGAQLSVGFPEKGSNSIFGQGCETRSSGNIKR